MWEHLAASSASQLLTCGCQQAADDVHSQQLPHICHVIPLICSFCKGIFTIVAEELDAARQLLNGLGGYYWLRVSQRTVCQQLQCCWVQGQWLLYGGCWTGEAYNTLHVFDFEKLAWSNPKLGGSNPLPRYYHMATCHKQAMVVLGGHTSHSHICSVPL